MQHVHWAEPGTVVTPPLRRLLVFFFFYKILRNEKSSENKKHWLRRAKPFRVNKATSRKWQLIHLHTHASISSTQWNNENDDDDVITTDSTRLRKHLSDCELNDDSNTRRER